MRKCLSLQQRAKALTSNTSRLLQAPDGPCKWSASLCLGHGGQSRCFAAAEPLQDELPADRAEPLREEQARAGLVRELLRVQLETVTQSLQPQASHNVLAESLQPIKDLLEARRRHPGNEGHVADAFARQLKREEISMHDTVAKYHKTVEKAEARSAGQDLNPAQRLMADWIRPLAAAVRDMLERVEEGRFMKEGPAYTNSRGHYQPMSVIELRDFMYLKALEPEELAGITLRSVVGHCLMFGKDQHKAAAIIPGTLDDKLTTVTPLLMEIGQTVAARGAYRALEGKVQDEARRAAESRRIWNHLKNDKGWSEIEAQLRDFKAQQQPGLSPEEATRKLGREERRELALELLSQLVGRGRDEFKDHLDRGFTGNLQFLKQNLSYKRLLKGLPENPEQWRRGQRKKVESLTPDHLLFRKDSALRVGGILVDLAERSVMYHTRNKAGEFVKESVFEYGQVTRERKTQGFLRLRQGVLSQMQSYHQLRELLEPRFMPMVCKPLPWTSYDKGGYILWRAPILRHKQVAQLRMMGEAERQNPGQLARIYEAMNVLGEQAYRVNGPMLDVVLAAVAENVGTAGLPITQVGAVMEKPDRAPRFRTQASKGQLSVAMRTDETWFEYARRRHENGKLRKALAEVHSQACDLTLRIKTARDLRDEPEIYFPQTLDFRGRVYPMHPHLNPQGPDVCRGLLLFAEARPLGKRGMDWLLIQVANHYGQTVDKRSFAGRIAFAREHVAQITASAANPLGHGIYDRWWVKGDNPWQLLATCMELRSAWACGNVEEYPCAFPVHVDGTCNGLQHYAALGRDLSGGAAVNLMPADKPQDVYTLVAAKVMDKMRQDLQEAEDSIRSRAELARRSFGKHPSTLAALEAAEQQVREDTQARAMIGRAQMLLPQVDRKLVKQTVMTSVYGVTQLGARDQIVSRLKERGMVSDEHTSRAAAYGAKVTINSLHDVFDSAKGIMAWLARAARAIASGHLKDPASGNIKDRAKADVVHWTTPLGLPAMQHYRTGTKEWVYTKLQRVTLRREDGPVDIFHQSSAFPPNYIHSLDSSHMMMTALRCSQLGMAFCGVHDSFWTHACNADALGVQLREAFIELHSQPLLENLHKQLVERYPDIAIPDLPARQEGVAVLDLNKVLEAEYFFN